MKKIIACLLFVIMCVGLVGCGEDIDKNHKILKKSITKQLTDEEIAIIEKNYEVLKGWCNLLRDENVTKDAIVEYSNSNPMDDTGLNSGNIIYQDITYNFIGIEDCLKEMYFGENASPVAIESLLNKYELNLYQNYTTMHASEIPFVAYKSKELYDKLNQ